MKNTTMKLSDFRAKMNTTLLKRIGAGEESIILTSHGFPVAQVTAIPTVVTVSKESLERRYAGSDKDWQTAWLTETIDPTTNINTAPHVITRDIFPSDEDAADVKAARESLAEPGRKPWSEVREELGLDPPEVKKIPFVTTTPGQGKRTGFEYSVPLPECSLEMLETLLTNTKQEDTIERAKIMTAIVKHRPFTATETEIYRQLMAPFIPPPSDDGT